MKSKGLLLSVFVAILFCTTSAMAQTYAKNDSEGLQEIGPNNLGGRITSLVADENTLYAGAAIGGLYKKDITTDYSAWQHVPCYLENGHQLALPITSMAKSGNELYIATGESGYMTANNIAPMSAKGRGLWKMTLGSDNPTFTCLVDPSTNSDFQFINEIVIYSGETTTRHFAATEQGLYTSADGWQTMTRVFDGAVRDMEITEIGDMLYFTTPGAIYRISNVASDASVASPVCITNNEPLFATAGGNIKIAVAPSDATYLYAMVFNTDGTLKGIYLTRNQQTWTLLNTSSVTPFTTLRNGNNCGSICVDAENPKKIYVGGEDIWSGQGYIDNSIYQWTNCSYSEAVLNGGNYMSMVYNTPVSVHSGIHQILHVNGSFYIATNAGIYSTMDFSDGLFNNISIGLNNVQVVDFAICPDGSIIMGANEMASPFLTSRSNYYGGDTNINHSASVLFLGSGGQPAASRYQKHLPSPHRGIFVSANGLNFGRAFNDYSDYTQNQTWTVGEEFISNVASSGYDVPRMLLWETSNNTIIHDTTTFVIDTLGSIIRDGVELQFNKDTIITENGISRHDTLNRLPFEIQAGDVLRLAHPGFFGYPFEYTFTQPYTLSEDNMHLRVQSPLFSRLFITAKRTEGSNVYSTVLMNWTPTDFRKVWTSDDYAVGKWTSIMNWAKVVDVSSSKGHDVRQIAISNDCDAIFAAVSNSTDSTYYILRVKGLNSIEINDTNKAINILYNYANPNRLTVVDTLKHNGSALFTRPITSLTYDPRSNMDRLIVTFGGEDNEAANVVLFDNATGNFTSAEKSLTNKAIPAYSSMVEFTTGEVYIGTEEGIFVTSTFDGTPSWEEYGDFAGIPVTSMHQQIDTLKRTTIITHNGINVEKNVFMKTKYPYAMYFGTYGHGVFMDLKYVTDRENESLDPTDYEDIPTVTGIGDSKVRVFPNPATTFSTLDIILGQGGNTIVKIYDINGKAVLTENLGYKEAGNHKETINCQNLRKGVYLINVVSGKSTATTKLVVR